MGLLAVAVVAPLLRVTGARTWQVLFAEDATVYYQELRADGPLAVLLRPYNGYAQLPTRVLAAPSTLLPIDQAPVYFAVVGAIVAALVAAATVHLARAWIPHPVLRVALGTLMVLSPVSGEEITANLVNLIWLYVAALPWAIASLEERRRDVVVRGLIVVAAATSQVLAFVFVPLALGFVWWRRTRAAAIVAGAYGVGLAIQGAVMLGAPSDAVVPPERVLADLTRLAGARLGAAPLVGGEAAAALWTDHGDGFLLGATLVVASLLVAVGIGADKRGRIVGVVLAGHAAAVFGVLALGRGTNVFRFTGSLQVFEQARYSYVPEVLLFGAFAAMAASRRRPDSGVSRLLPVVLVTHVVVLVATSFTVGGFRGTARPWTEAVEATRAECAAPGADPDDVVAISQDRFGFFITRLRCRDLEP